MTPEEKNKKIYKTHLEHGETFCFPDGREIAARGNINVESFGHLMSETFRSHVAASHANKTDITEHTGKIATEVAQAKMIENVFLFACDSFIAQLNALAFLALVDLVSFLSDSDIKYTAGTGVDYCFAGHVARAMVTMRKWNIPPKILVHEFPIRPMALFYLFFFLSSRGT